MSEIDQLNGTGSAGERGDPEAPAEEKEEPQRAAGAAGEGGAGGGNGSNGHGVSKEQVLEALKNVIDPELGINIVDLGLVYEVRLEDDTVHIEYTLTTMGCPIGPLIESQMQQLLEGQDGIEHVEAEMVLRPPWTPEMMSEEAKAALGYF